MSIKPIRNDDLSNNETLRYLLGAIRSHLGMEVGFISEFSNGNRIFRMIDSSDDEVPIKMGDKNPLEESYCQRVVDGRLPQLILDAALNPEALNLPVTTELPVGGHISTPIYLDDGNLYGTICCFSREPTPTLRERDLAMLRLVADFAGKEISRKFVQVHSQDEMLERVQAIVDSASLNIVYQPIYHLEQERTVGFEALARFPTETYRSPDICFDEAKQVGLSEELEMLALKKALSALDSFPEDIYITLNTSPEHILSGAVDRILDGLPNKRLVVEITEHAFVPDYTELCRITSQMQEKGIEVAVDDAGAGYASFHHILELKPDIIKLDMKLIRNIHIDSRRRALAAGLISFAFATGARVVAEGVENIEELDVLRDLGVNKVQGYFIGRPSPISEARGFLDDFTLKH